MKIKTQAITNPIQSNEVMGSSYLVTVDDYDSYKNPRLIDRNTFNHFSFKNGNFSDSAQVDFDLYGVDFKTPEYPLEFLSGLLRINTYHEECCDRVSLDVTKHGWDIVSTKSDYKEADLNLRLEIIDWINSMPEAASDLLQECVYDFEALGVTAWELIRENGLGSPLQYITRFDVTHSMLSTDDKRVKQTIGTDTAWFQLYNTTEQAVHRDTGVFYPRGVLPPEQEAHEVVWIRKYKTNSDAYGSAKISKAVDVIESEIGRANFNRKFFENYGMPAFAVTVIGNFKDMESQRFLPDGTVNPDFDETKTLKYIIGQQLKEIQMNPHSALVITIPTSMGMGEVEVKITPLSTDVKEASFRLLREDNKQEICAAHGMSSDLIGTTQTGNLGGTSLELDLSSYGKNKIKPIQTIFNNAFTMLVQERFETTEFKFKLNEHELEDKDKKIERAIKLGNAGLMTRREQMVMLSQTFNLNPDTDNEYLDRYLINGHTEEEIFEKQGQGYNYYNYLDSNYATKSDVTLLEQDLLDKAYELYCDDENGTDGNISNKSKARTGIPEFAREIIKDNFRKRREYNEKVNKLVR